MTTNGQNKAYSGQALCHYDGRPSTPRLLQGGLSDISGVQFEVVSFFRSPGRIPRFRCPARRLPRLEGGSVDSLPEDTALRIFLRVRSP